MTASLQVNRSLQNDKFSSFRLGKSFVQGKDVHQLPGCVAVSPSTETDYLHTRALLMRNHVVFSAGRWFLFIRPEQAGPISLLQMCPDAPGKLVKVAGRLPWLLTKVA